MGRGITVMHIYGSQLKYLSLPLPPFSEQTAIARFLDKTAAEIDNSVNCVKREIELFREYRTRLIADVVTGKLDVRGAAAELTESMPDTDEDAIDAVRVEAGFRMADERIVQEENR